jgi:hypothetical protein
METLVAHTLTSSRAPWLWLNVSPAIPILFGYLFLICISSFIHASATDPGVSHNLHVPLAIPKLTTSRYYPAICIRFRHLILMTTHSFLARRLLTG